MILLNDPFLDHSLTQYKIVKNIYEKLSKKICKEIESIIIIYDGRPIENNEKEICKFLMSKDFYKYKVQVEDDILLRQIIDFQQKKNGTYLKTIIKQEKDKSNESLCTTKLLECLEEYSNCKNDDKFKMNEKNKESFLIEYFKDYVDCINELNELFNYENLSSDDRNSILSQIDVDVCPYCNRNYISKYEKNGKQKSLADLDHFYVKSINPLYSLCLYNFIPACSICNSRLKGTKDMNVEEYIYPYIDSYENKANFIIKNMDKVIIKNESPQIRIKYSSENKNDKVKKSTERFEIEKIYSAHTAYAQDIVSKAFFYNKNYREDISKIINSHELKSLIFGEPLKEDDFLHTSLGKLKRDLLLQLGVYDKN